MRRPPQNLAQTHTTREAEATRLLGEKLGQSLQTGDVVALSGPLGAGKTTLVQGIARGLGAGSEPASPTFVLIVEHEARVPLLHLDAYRLEDATFELLQDAGVLDFLAREDAVRLIEWPERIEPWLPPSCWRVTLESGKSEDERRITIALLG